MSVARQIPFTSHVAKARWIDGAAWIDATDPRVQDAACELGGGEDTAPELACVAIVQWIRDHVSYTRDRWRDGREAERVADTPTILAEKLEDCDGKARAVVALVRALGLARGDQRLLARLRACLDEEGAFTHAQAEVSPDGGRTWILAETIVDGVPLGASPDVGERDAHGQLVIR